MANSFHKLYLHLVFAPRYRRALITPTIRDRVEKYITGVIKNIDCVLIEIYARPDHIHILLKFKTTHSVAAIVNKIKTNSSKWIAETLSPGFQWQDGGGYFTVGYIAVPIVARYIRNQEAHHAKQTMPEEFKTLLIEHDLLDEVDPKYCLIDPE